MSTIKHGKSVGELVRDNPARARVFESVGIDYCCGGKTPLGNACREKGLDLSVIMERLRECDLGGTDGDASPAGMSLTALADKIEQSHHAYLRAELPRLVLLSNKVASAHGERDPRLLRVRDVVASFASDMSAHMLKEERILFPMIRALDSGTGQSLSHCGSVADPIRQMEAEHEGSGEDLASMRELTDGFVAPAGACNTYLAMLDALAGLERDTHEHVHKENSILFPRAIELELAGAKGESV